jgi:hypothetical protein
MYLLILTIWFIHFIYLFHSVACFAVVYIAYCSDMFYILHVLWIYGTLNKLNWIELNSVQNLLSSCLLSKNAKIRIYKTIILPVVLYGCETWPLTLRKKHRLWVFKNRVLKRIFGMKRDKVTGGRRKLHNEELHNLHFLPSIITIIK